MVYGYYSGPYEKIDYLGISKNIILSKELLFGEIGGIFFSGLLAFLFWQRSLFFARGILCALVIFGIIGAIGIFVLRFQFEVISPAGGERFMLGTVMHIKWKTPHRGFMTSMAVVNKERSNVLDPIFFSHSWGYIDERDWVLKDVSSRLKEGEGYRIMLCESENKTNCTYSEVFFILSPQ